MECEKIQKGCAIDIVSHKIETERRVQKYGIDRCFSEAGLGPCRL